MHSQAATITTLTHQLEWFKRQVFGNKSERFAPELDPTQMHLGEVLPVPTTLPESRKSVPAHTRRVPTTDLASAEAVPFFDESRVPMETITVSDTAMKQLAPNEFEVIGEKVSYRLAQRPGSYVVLKVVRPLIKRLDSHTIHCAPAPVGVLEGSRADVSFIAGLLVDKFAYHLPLYRQHPRLTDSGITVSRPWLTQLAQHGIGLLEPRYDAQFASLQSSRVKAMDETPIKAVLISDGYAAYQRYAEKTGLTHAQCWAHARRKFFEAQDSEPTGVTEALEHIPAMYKVEADLRERQLAGEQKRYHRLTHSKPHLEAFFDWVEQPLARQGFTPSNPFIKALNYVRERRLGLEVFLTDPDVPIDTNHLERALRVIPIGRKSWLFCWTELGAKHVDIIQSLIVTCRLHGIDPYTYLLDVLQRVGQHPAARVAELTPRLWKVHFADNPLRSDLYALPA